MYEADVALFRCPKSKSALQLVASVRAEDGEILEGKLVADGHEYAIRNGIPRFVESSSYNPTWDYKWTVLDRGVGHNYRIIDEKDQAYQIHDIFDRNGYDGRVYRKSTNGLALDIGCGIGQYSVKLMRDYAPEKLVALDLTGGVDIFRKILLERYPQFKTRIVIVQASAFDMPFADETFDFVMSLGVLHHTGDTRQALTNACKLVKPKGNINFWVYCSEPVGYSISEKGRENALSIANIEERFLRNWKWPTRLIRLFRRLDHASGVKLLRFLSSDFVFNLSRRKGFLWTQRIFAHVDYPDEGYRLVNHYDGYMNTWDESWNENELFPVLKQHDIVIVGISDWRLGIWGQKLPGIYPD
jgi:SAM-dependent methyltransferase